VDSGGVDVPFVWSNGAYETLPTLAGNTDSLAASINSSGEIVGNSYVSGGIEACIWPSSDRIEGLGTLTGAFGELSGANCISDDGVIGGWSYKKVSDTLWYTRGVLWYPDRGMVELPTPQVGGICYVESINGEWKVGSNFKNFFNTFPQACRWSGPENTFETFGTFPGGYVSESLAVNIHGDTVGVAQGSFVLPIYYNHAFLVMGDGDDLFDLNNHVVRPVSGSVELTRATGMNDLGWITCWGFETAGKNDHAVPQAGGWLLVLIPETGVDVEDTSKDSSPPSVD
jgi:uncharacterized membrane protein